MIEQALEDVAQIHPSITTEFEVGATQDWYGDPWARGAFALFEPGSRPGSSPTSSQPEGRIHFAGEHTSLYHAWIQGALESAFGPPRRSTRRRRSSPPKRSPPQPAAEHPRQWPSGDD